MPNCESYQRLADEEKKLLIAELTHAIQNDEWSFQLAQSMINKARSRGVFDDVRFYPSEDRQPFLSRNLMPTYWSKKQLVF